MRDYFHVFGKQVQRFGSVLWRFLCAVFAYSPRLVLQTAVFSFLGAGAQGAAIGGVLYTIRKMEDAADVDQISVSLPILDELTVPTPVPFLVCVLLLAFGMLGLYLAERSAVKLSVGFANARAGRFISFFPLFSDRVRGAALDPETGAPRDLNAHVRLRLRRLELAARSIFRSPTAILQLMYGLAFALYLEPVLTFLLAVSLLPFVLLLRTFARQVTQAERDRGTSMTAGAKELQNLLGSAHGYSLNDLLRDEHLANRFQGSSFADANRHVGKRILGMARSEALGNAALTVAFAVSVLYFTLYRGLENLSVGDVVVFLISIQIAAFAGRQLARRVARFGRFYEAIREILYAEAGSQAEPIDKEDKLVVRAPTLEGGSRTEVTVAAGEPTAIIGCFPLTALGLGHVAVMKGANRAVSHAELVASMEYVPLEGAEPHLQVQGHAHRPQQNSNAASLDRLKQLSRQKRSGDSVLGAESAITGGAVPQGEPKRAERVLLTLAECDKPIVVVQAECLRAVTAEFRDAWHGAVTDRRVLVFHRAVKGNYESTGERQGVVVGTRGVALAAGDSGTLSGGAQRLHELFCADLQRVEAERRMAPIEDDDED